mgnify:CR=1 FL=1
MHRMQPPDSKAELQSNSNCLSSTLQPSCKMLCKLNWCSGSSSSAHSRWFVHLRPASRTVVVVGQSVPSNPLRVNGRGVLCDTEVISPSAIAQETLWKDDTPRFDTKWFTDSFRRQQLILHGVRPAAGNEAAGGVGAAAVPILSTEGTSLTQQLANCLPIKKHWPAS